MNDHTRLSFFASAAEPCSYLENKNAISAFANPNVDMDMKTYNELIQHGFRRSGGYVYRPIAPVAMNVSQSEFLLKNNNLHETNCEQCGVTLISLSPS